jgi:hypothetical protein
VEAEFRFRENLGFMVVKLVAYFALPTMSVSLRENSLARTSFVRGGEQVTVSRKRKGDVNTADGAAAFTAEESTSFYGNLVGLPSNVRLRRAPSGGTSTWGLDSSNRLNEAAGDDGVHREPSGSVASANLSESNIGFQVRDVLCHISLLEPLPSLFCNCADSRRPCAILVPNFVSNAVCFGGLDHGVPYFTVLQISTEA